MNNKEAIAVLKSNYPHGRVMLSEAVDLSIKTLEAAESQTTVVQQLKAEIADLLSYVEDSMGSQVAIRGRYLAERLRQLSAI